MTHTTEPTIDEILRRIAYWNSNTRIVGNIPKTREWTL